MSTSTLPSSFVEPTTATLPIKRGVVFIADDDEWLLEANQAILEGEGWEVVTAKDVLEATHHLTSRKYDRVVLDNNLTGITSEQPGLVLAEMMRRDSVNADTPVLMITGDGESPDFLSRTAAADVKVLKKPYLMKDFIKAVEGKALCRET